MSKIYELNYLTDDFYQKYNSTDYSEIENKKSRPYMVLLIKVDDNTFLIPFSLIVNDKNDLHQLNLV